MSINYLDPNSLVISFAIVIFLFVSAIFYWEKLLIKINWLKKYKKIQRIHEGEVPRLGGVIIYIGIFFYWLINEKIASYYIDILLISIFPLFLICIKEDIFHNTSAKVRLIIIFFSIFLFLYLGSPQLPIVPFIDFAFENNKFYILEFIFFCFCVVIITNGNNLIDGANGLMPMSVIAQFLSLFFLADKYSDYEFIYLLIFFGSFLVIFLFFNFPMGRIFLGDFGAYFYGFIISTLTISLFGKYPEISPWNAVLILFYPSFELLFSFTRKLLNGKNPMEADNNHLHSRIFQLLKKLKQNNFISQNLITPCMIMIWGMPTLLLVIFHENSVMVILNIILMISFYSLIYYKVSKRLN